MIHRCSPAKVNLILQVLGRRADGYHELATLMQKVDLNDRISFRTGGKGTRIECPGGSLPVDESNLAHRAARAIFSRASDDPGIRIIVEKNIPIGAGLGGGSSNAATVLMALNELFGYGFGQAELMELGEKIGADVPFFIFADAAWAFGKGERLVSAGVLPAMWFVLVYPGFEVSTREVYAGLKMNSKMPLTKEELQFNIPKFFSLGDLAGGLRNDLERVTVTLHPVIADLKRMLLRYGALGSLMSGSGSSVFGIFSERKDAERAAEEIRREGSWSVFAAKSL